MTSDLPETTADDSAAATTRSAAGLTVVISVAVVAAVFAMFFIMGFVSAWLKSEGDLMALVMRGLKFGLSGSAGVICVGVSAKSWQRLPVPPWLPPMASFAVGFFVMHGLGEILDGRYETALPKAGSGFLSGCLAGLGIYWVQKKGWVKHTPLNSKSARPTTHEQS